MMLEELILNDDPNNLDGAPMPKFRRRRQWPVVFAVVFVALVHGFLAAIVALGSNPVVSAVAAAAVSLCGVVVVLTAALEL